MSRVGALAARAGLALPDGAGDRLDAYADLLRGYNARLNLVARTDAAHVEDRHVLHCLALGRRPFPPGATVVDWGTGGGLPVIPLAVLNPDVPFVGVDTVEKKVLAVRAMARALVLPNIEAWHGRAEAFRAPHTHSVSRATAPLATLWAWHAPGAVAAEPVEGAWPPGLVCLKGGDLTDEVAALHETVPGLRVAVEPVRLPGVYYADKHVVIVTGPAV